MGSHAACSPPQPLVAKTLPSPPNTPNHTCALPAVAAAQEAGKFKDEIVPVETDQTIEKDGEWSFFNTAAEPWAAGLGGVVGTTAAVTCEGDPPLQGGVLWAPLHCARAHPLGDSEFPWTLWPAVKCSEQ